MQKFLLFNLTFVCFIMSCSMLSAGSYPGAEIYQFTITKDSLIRSLSKLRRRDTSLLVPESYHINDNAAPGSSPFYYMYFYNPEGETMYLTFVRSQITDNSAELALVRVYDEKTGKWRTINKDLSYADNLQEKKNFERLIVNRIAGGIKSKYGFVCRSYYL